MARRNLIVRIIGKWLTPLRPLFEWAACELRFGELMGAFVFGAAVAAWIDGWRGFLVVVVGYLVTVLGDGFLLAAVVRAEESDEVT